MERSIPLRPFGTHSLREKKNKWGETIKKRSRRGWGLSIVFKGERREGEPPPIRRLRVKSGLEKWRESGGHSKDYRPERREYYGS